VRLLDGEHTTSWSSTRLIGREPRRRRCRLKKLDGIARGIFDDDLLTAHAVDDRIPEMRAVRTKLLDDAR